MDQKETFDWLVERSNRLEALETVNAALRSRVKTNPKERAVIDAALKLWNGTIVCGKNDYDEMKGTQSMDLPVEYMDLLEATKELVEAEAALAEGKEQG